MITIYGYVPGFGVPDISPYVTKVIYYMRMTGLEFQHQPQNLATLDEDSPTGKLPYIVDSDGTKVADSSLIISYFKSKYGDPLDAGLTPAEVAQNLAWSRLIEEHLYWSGIIEPRWRLDEGWETYIPIIVQGADVTPEMRVGLDAFRQRILDEFNGQGMGRRSSEAVQDIFRVDIDALSDFLGDKRYFTGDSPPVDRCICHLHAEAHRAAASPVARDRLRPDEAEHHGLPRPDDRRVRPVSD